MNNTKKKVTITIVVILSVIACIAFGFILVNVIDKSEESSKSTEDLTNNVEQSDEENKQGKTNYTNVTVDSKIGLEIVEKISITNMYSEEFFKELNTKGFSPIAKTMYTFLKISNNEDYKGYFRISEDYIGEYITKDDLVKVAKDMIEDTSNMAHKELFITGSYDEVNKNYVVVPMGFAGNDFEYTVQIPYDIKEYDTHVEVLVYNLYITRLGDYVSDEESYNDTVFYDVNRTKEAVKISDDKMYDEYEQISLLKGKIDKAQINKKDLSTSKWTLKKSNNKYLVSNYELLKNK